jgi:outer membrane protein assembly factor BamE (lipoprotein component of BamABCDE complex)
MRTVRKTLLRGGVALLGIAACAYATDDLWARFRGRPVEQMKVDRVYLAMNHWNQVEYSLGTPIMQTCVDALMPHFGVVPCWYLRRHTLQQVKTY